jgi:signal transduction histidine kinase
LDRTQTDQYRRLRATLIGGIAPLLLLFLAASAWQELSERQAALRAAETETAALARALDERVSRTLATAEFVLGNVAEWVDARGGLGNADRGALLALLRAELRAHRELQALSVFDAGLRRVADTALPGGQADGSDLDYVSVHRERAEPGLHVARTRGGTAGGGLVIPVSARMDAHGGEFEGVAAATIPIESFDRFYRSLQAAPDAEIALMTLDGAELFRFPADRFAPGQGLGAVPAFRDALRGRSSGSAAVTLRADESRRIASYRRHWKLPVVSVVSRSEEEVLRRWREGLLARAAPLAAALVGSLVLAMLLLRQMRVRLAAESALRTLNEALEHRVQERTAELELANRELAGFSHAVAHDLRSTIGEIGAVSGLLVSDHGERLGGEEKRLLGVLEAGAARIVRVVDGLLELAFLAQNPLVRRPVNLTVLATELLDAHRRREPARAVQCAVAPGLRLNADPALLRRLMDSLIDNAWKFSLRNDGARIEVGASDGAYFVKDNGAGFDMAYASHLFQPFERLHDSREFPGLGLGLAIAERIVKRHGGRIWAQAAPGAGAIFWFTMPD